MPNIKLIEAYGFQYQKMKGPTHHRIIDDESKEPIDFWDSGTWYAPWSKYGGQVGLDFETFLISQRKRLNKKYEI